MKTRGDRLVVLGALVFSVVAGTGKCQEPGVQVSERSHHDHGLGALRRPRARGHEEGDRRMGRKNSAVNVKVAGDINTTKIVAAIRAGNAPDIAMDFESANIGSYCASGAWAISARISRRITSSEHFPCGFALLHAIQGKALRDAVARRRSRPLLQQEDVQGGGTQAPAQDDLRAHRYAKKLTKRNKDGSLKVVGFDSFVGWYTNSNDRFIGMFGGKWPTLKESRSWPRTRLGRRC